MKIGKINAGDTALYPKIASNLAVADPGEHLGVASFQPLAGFCQGMPAAGILQRLQVMWRDKPEFKSFGCVKVPIRRL
jgi:hypothetical protein